MMADVIGPLRLHLFLLAVIVWLRSPTPPTRTKSARLELARLSIFGPVISRRLRKPVFIIASGG